MGESRNLDVSGILNLFCFLRIFVGVRIWVLVFTFGGLEGIGDSVYIKGYEIYDYFI